MSLYLLFCAILAGLVFALLGYLYKVAHQFHCRVTPFILVFTGTAGCISLLRTHWESSTWDNPQLWLFGCLGGLALYLAIQCVLYANYLGPASITWAIVNLSLLLPIIFFCLFFHEHIYPVDIASLTLFMFMLLFFARSLAKTGEVPVKNRWRYGLALVILFVTNGSYMLMTKIKAAVWYDQNTASYMAISFLMGTFLAGITYLFQHKRQPLARHEWRVGIYAGLASVSGTLLFLTAASLPTMVLLPVTQGISLLGGVLLTLLLYHEHTDPLKMTGFAFGVAVLMLSVCRDNLAHLIHW